MGLRRIRRLAFLRGIRVKVRVKVKVRARARARARVRVRVRIRRLAFLRGIHPCVTQGRC